MMHLWKLLCYRMCEWCLIVLLLIDLNVCIFAVFKITVFRIGEATQDIDLAILAALLKSTSSSVCIAEIVH